MGHRQFPSRGKEARWPITESARDKFLSNRRHGKGALSACISSALTRASFVGIISVKASHVVSAPFNLTRRTGPTQCAWMYSIVRLGKGDFSCHKLRRDYKIVRWSLSCSMLSFKSRFPTDFCLASKNEENLCTKHLRIDARDYYFSILISR